MFNLRTIKARVRWLIWIGYPLTMYLNIRGLLEPVGWDYIFIVNFMLVLVWHLQAVHDKAVHMQTLLDAEIGGHIGMEMKAFIKEMQGRDESRRRIHNEKDNGGKDGS
jgi:hypothetical protein